MQVGAGVQLRKGEPPSAPQLCGGDGAGGLAWLAPTGLRVTRPGQGLKLPSP